MLFKLVDAMAGYVKESPAWPVLRPVFALLSLYVTALVLVYQFVEWQYRLSPPVSLFLRSYLVKQVTVVCVAIVLILSLIERLMRPAEVAARADSGPEGPAARGQPTPEGEPTASRPARRFSLPGRRTLRVLGAVAVVVAATGALFAWLAPRSVANIRVKFLAEPEVDRYAVTYILYELNRAQKQWFFEVDFDVFNENALTSRERQQCAASDREPTLCVADLLAGQRPFIGITSEPLEDDFFWKNRGPVSVVSTHAWRQYAPPTEYEFVTHAVIVQSVVIHLNAHCTGLPVGAFRESRVSVNDLFQFTPRRHAMKAAILAAHLDRRGELLLFNCFGPEYVSVVTNLLALDWLRAGRVRENLERAFRVKILG
jgi:hypothetical protein